MLDALQPWFLMLCNRSPAKEKLRFDGAQWIKSVFATAAFVSKQKPK
jgi:hypothetical protein